MITTKNAELRSQFLKGISPARRLGINLDMTETALEKQLGHIKEHITVPASSRQSTKPTTNMSDRSLSKSPSLPNAPLPIILSAKHASWPKQNTDPSSLY